MTAFDAPSYFKFHRGLEEIGAQNGIFIPGFWTFHPEIPTNANGYGFVCANQWKNAYSIIPDQYINALPAMDLIIHQGITGEGILPKEGKRVLEASNQSGYRFI